MTSDYILNGRSHGSIAATLLSNDFDVGMLRPYIGKDGRSYITRNEGGKLRSVPVNNVATLRHEEWKLLDEAVISAAKERLRIVGDLRGAGLTYNIPNGMAKTVLMTETVSDITPAQIDMDPAVEAEGDTPQFDLTNLPLPVVHKGFRYTARQIASSRGIGASLDVTNAQLCARRVAEMVEKLTLGVSSSFTYGGGTVYGLKNFPSRITGTVTAPTGGGWTGTTLVNEVLAMKQASMDAFHYGPWALYFGPSWDQYLNKDYSTSYPNNTIRQRLLAIDGIQDVRIADYLGTGVYDVFLVQLTSDVIRLVIGMDVTTIQWETMGGMNVHFKVMAIIVPQLRADQNNNTGIVHYSTS